MPEEVQDAFGFALHQAQAGGKSDAAKPLKGFGPQACSKSSKTGMAMLPSGLHRPLFERRLRAVLLSEEIDRRCENARA